MKGCNCPLDWRCCLLPTCPRAEALKNAMQRQWEETLRIVGNPAVSVGAQTSRITEP